jgi:hypothetical protein
VNTVLVNKTQKQMLADLFELNAFDEVMYKQWLTVAR